MNTFDKAAIMLIVACIVIGLAEVAYLMFADMVL